MDAIRLHHSSWREPAATQLSKLAAVHAGSMLVDMPVCACKPW